MKPQPQIIDLTKSQTPAALKPIELVGCLQDFDFEDQDHRFQFNTEGGPSSFDSTLKKAKTIKRLAILGREYPHLKCMNLSLIEVDEVIFLGHWNDGVV